MAVEFTDNSGDVINRISNGVVTALTMIGTTAEGYAKMACPVDTGALRNSITFAVQGNTLHVGTNMEYAPYVELGTGQYAEGGGGSLVTFDKDGNAHTFNGMRAQPYLKPAIGNHTSEYMAMIAAALGGK